MRVIKSPIGSFTAMSDPPLPARLHKAWDQALVAEFAQRDTRQLMLAVIGARTAGHLATIADARGRRIARQFGKLERGREALFHRLGLVHGDLFQPRTAAGKRLRHPATPLVLFDRTLLRHQSLL